MKKNEHRIAELEAHARLLGVSRDKYLADADRLGQENRELNARIKRLQTAANVMLQALGDCQQDRQQAQAALAELKAQPF